MLGLCKALGKQLYRVGIYLRAIAFGSRFEKYIGFFSCFVTSIIVVYARHISQESVFLHRNAFNDATEAFHDLKKKPFKIQSKLSITSSRCFKIESTPFGKY